MNEKTPPRRPATFKLDDPGVVVMDPEDSGRLTRGTIQIVPEAEPAQLPVPADTPLLPARRGFRWGTLFWSAVAGLVVLGSGLYLWIARRRWKTAGERVPPGARPSGAGAAE